MRRLRIKPITIGVHPKFYAKMEELRESFKQKDITLSQMELTNMIATKMKLPKVNLLGVKNARQKRKSN